MLPCYRFEEDDEAETLKRLVQYVENGYAEKDDEPT